MLCLHYCHSLLLDDADAGCSVCPCLGLRLRMKKGSVADGGLSAVKNGEKEGKWAPRIHGRRKRWTYELCVDLFHGERVDKEP